MNYHSFIRQEGIIASKRPPVPDVRSCGACPERISDGSKAIEIT
jgi:hypothetical protein